LGRTEEAEAKLKEAIQLDPNLLSACFDLGKLYYKENLLPQAIDVLDRAVERYPQVDGDKRFNESLGRFHFLLALAYFKNADGRNAQYHFREVTKLVVGTRLDEDARKYLDLLE
jgi:tetratricopeptide (TPR) repeat protein